MHIEPIGAIQSAFPNTIKEGETRKLSPACGLRKFPQNDH